MEQVEFLFKIDKFLDKKNILILTDIVISFLSCSCMSFKLVHKNTTFEANSLK